MIKSLLKLGLLLVTAILIYNYFLGTPDEKENARKVFGEVKDVAVSVKELLQSEKEKFDKGKYDKAIDKLGGLLNKLKKDANEFDSKYLDRIDELERKRTELQRALAELDETGERKSEFTPKGVDVKDKEAIRREMDKLMRDTDQLIREMEQKK